MTRQYSLRHARTPVLSALAIAVIAALAACSSVPDRNVALEEARSVYSTAQSTPDVPLYAAEELKRAGAALQLAEKRHADGEKRPEVDHLAYLARQRVVLAQATADSRAAQAVTTGAAAERDRMRLELRTAEADATQRQLNQSQQAGARQAADLAQADRDAQASREALAQRDAEVGNLEAQLREMNARKTDRGIVVTLGDMLFDTGKSQLQPGSNRSLVQLADFFRRHPERRAAIEGYTDSVGSDSSNQALSDRRARSVMAALTGMGVGAERLTALGLGESAPVAGNDSAAGRQMNRRVEIIFAAQSDDIVKR
jgi:outer membrane protein OmpA-like peptidoglycan-associated protein